MSSPSSLHSPFWGLQILVVALGAWIGYQIMELYWQREATLAAMHRIVPEAQAGLDARKKYLALVEDLHKTAVKDSGAAQVLREEKIDVKEPSSPSPNP